MPVYFINNMLVRDSAEYKKYLSGFMPNFERFGGKVLAAQNAPAPTEGPWPYDRTVLLSFTSRDAAEQWANSPDYYAIAEHRHAGTISNVAFVEGLPQ